MSRILDTVLSFDLPRAAIATLLAFRSVASEHSTFNLAQDMNPVVGTIGRELR